MLPVVEGSQPRHDSEANGRTNQDTEGDLQSNVLRSLAVLALNQTLVGLKR